MDMTRRQFLTFLMAGGVVTADELGGLGAVGEVTLPVRGYGH